MACISFGGFQRISLFALYSAGLKTIRYFTFRIFQVKGPSPLMSAFADGFSQFFGIIFELLYRVGEKGGNNNKYQNMLEDKTTTKRDILTELENETPDGTSNVEGYSKTNKSETHKEVEQFNILNIIKSEGKTVPIQTSAFHLYFCGGFLVSFLSLIGSITENVMNCINDTESKNNYDYPIGILCISKLIEFSCNSFLCLGFLHIELYRHQLFSLILITIVTGSIVGISRVYMLQFKLVLTLGYALFSITEVMKRWLMHDKYASLFYLMFLSGLFTLVLTPIIGLIITILEKKEVVSQSFQNILRSIFIFDEFIEKIKDWKFCLGMAITILLSTFYNMFHFFIIKYIGPTFWSLNDYLCFPLIYGVSYALGEPANQFVLILIGYLLLLMGSFIYHEYIILNCCGLGVNARKNIADRANIEDQIMAAQMSKIMEEGNDEDEDEESFSSI